MKSNWITWLCLFCLFLVLHFVPSSSLVCYKNHCSCGGDNHQNFAHESCKCEYNGVGKAVHCGLGISVKVFCTETTLNKTIGQVHSRGCGIDYMHDEGESIHGDSTKRICEDLRYSHDLQFDDGIRCHCYQDFCNKIYINTIKRVNNGLPDAPVKPVAPLKPAMFF